LWIVGVIAIGEEAPAIPGLAFEPGPTALVFYKVTCPVCQMAAPKVAALEDAYPGHVVGLGQDPEDQLASFDAAYGFGAPSFADLAPYEVSNAYRIEAVPTLILVGRDGVVRDVVQSWDREGYNRVARELAEGTGLPLAEPSDSEDGLPAFRPG
jgi:thiol-disulfide isomerase/thioredoxin